MDTHSYTYTQSSISLSYTHTQVWLEKMKNGYTHGWCSEVRDGLDHTGTHTHRWTDRCAHTHLNIHTQNINGDAQTDQSFIIYMSCLYVRQGFYSRRAAFHTLSVLQKVQCVFCVCVSASRCAHAIRAAMLEVKWLDEEHLLALRGPHL